MLLKPPCGRLGHSSWNSPATLWRSNGFDGYGLARALRMRQRNMFGGRDRRRTLSRRSSQELRIHRSRICRIALTALATRAVFVAAPVDDGDPKQWGHASNDLLIARRIAMIGAGRCVHQVVRKPGDTSSRGHGVAGSGLDLCGTRIAKDLGRSRRCSHHGSIGRQGLTRRERDEITEFLHRVGRSLH